MLTNLQKSLIKRAQREAGLTDEDYRDALEASAGVRSTTDPRITNRGVDIFLSYVEAIHARKVAAGELQPSSRPDAIFKTPGFWRARNPSGNTTRDRFNGRGLADQVAELEARIRALGFDERYTAAIRSKVTHGLNDDRSLYTYCAALRRTLAAKSKNLGVETPR